MVRISKDMVPNNNLLLMTNVWNEEDSILGIIEHISKQTLKPKLWVWIDDGSTDNSAFMIMSTKCNIPMMLFSMPKKTQGNLDTIGKGYDKFMPTLKDMQFDYLTIADVDNRYPPDYYEKMCAYMDKHPEIGIVSAQVRGEGKRNPDNPMGGGKIIRWNIIKRIKQYWDLAPDSFLNIKARAMGYKVISLQDYYIDSAPTTGLTKTGRFRYGRRAYYVARHPFLLFYQAILFALKRDYASEFLRGYWQEWSKGTWRCQDPEVLYAFGLKYRYGNFTIRRFLLALKRLIT